MRQDSYNCDKCGVIALTAPEVVPERLPEGWWLVSTWQHDPVDCRSMPRKRLHMCPDCYSKMDGYLDVTKDPPAASADPQTP